MCQRIMAGELLDTPLLQVLVSVNVCFLSLLVLFVQFLLRQCIIVKPVTDIDKHRPSFQATKLIMYYLKVG